MDEIEAMERLARVTADVYEERVEQRQPSESRAVRRLIIERTELSLYFDLHVVLKPRWSHTVQSTPWMHYGSECGQAELVEARGPATPLRGFVLCELRRVLGECYAGL